MSVRLDAGKAQLVIDPDAGGRWVSLRVDGLELLTRTELPGAYAPTLSGCFPMAPYAGRVGGAAMTFGGRVYRLPMTGPPHAIHGTVLDVPWQVTAHREVATALRVPLSAPWPFAGVVSQQVTLRPDGLTAVLSLQAEQAMPVVMGYHPWFPRRLARGGPAQLHVRGGRQYQRGPDGLPTGKLVAPGPRPWDDCLVGVEEPLRLVWPGALELALRTSSAHWVIFDGLPDVVCVEPQTGPPDAVRLGEADVLPAGGEVRLTFTLTWVITPPAS